MTKNTTKAWKTNIKLNKTYKRSKSNKKKIVSSLSYKRREKWPSYCFNSRSYKEAWLWLYIGTLGLEAYVKWNLYPSLGFPFLQKTSKNTYAAWLAAKSRERGAFGMKKIPDWGFGYDYAFVRVAACARSRTRCTRVHSGTHQHFAAQHTSIACCYVRGMRSIT
jgi:hypothetical protein